MADGIQIGEGGRKSKLPRWQFVVGLVGVAVLAVVVGGLVRWSTTNNTGQDVSQKRRDLPEVVDDVQNLRIGAKPDEAQQKINDALNDPSTSDTIKYQLYIQQGSLAKQNGSITDAIASYEKAAAIKETYEITVLLGDTYATVDKAKAISWYKKALPLVPKEGNPVYEDDIATIEKSIQRVEAQP